jgi:O-antigen/teichoic acid export membrane protein
MNKNILANFIGKFWSILSNFLFIPLYIHYLGFESYSLISFTLVIAGLMAVLDAGLTATLSREFSRIDNSISSKIEVFNTLESSYFIIIGICILFIFSLSGFISHHWLNLKSFEPEKISFLLKIISFDIGFQLLFRFYMGGLLGLERQIEANMYQVGWGALRNGLVVFALFFVSSLDMFFIWQMCATIIFTLLIRLSLNNCLLGSYKLNTVFKIDFLVLKKIWRFAGGVLLISLVASLNTQMDKIVISRLLPVENLGYYTLAVSLSMSIIVLINPISVALLPKFTALYSVNNIKAASELFLKFNLFVSILIFSVMSSMIFFSKELIWVWTGNMQLASQAQFFLPVLATSIAMISLTILPFDIAMANGYTKLNNLLGLSSLFITLPGYWFATKSFGSIGAAYVFCFVQVINMLIYIYFINRKFIKVENVRILYVQQMLFPLLISLSVIFLLSMIPNCVNNNRVFTFIWIGFSTLFAISISIIILIPIREIKKHSILLNFKK